VGVARARATKTVRFLQSSKSDVGETESAETRFSILKTRSFPNVPRRLPFGTPSGQAGSGAFIAGRAAEANIRSFADWPDRHYPDRRYKVDDATAWLNPHIPDLHFSEVLHSYTASWKCKVCEHSQVSSIIQRKRWRDATARKSIRL